MAKPTDHDAYIKAAPVYAQPILKKIRAAYHKACPRIEETMKWSAPFFECEGLVGNMVAFKQHVGWGFWKGTQLTDLEGLFKAAGDTTICATKTSSLADLPSQKVLVAYIKEAVRINEEAAARPRTQRKQVGAKSAMRKPAVRAPAELAALLKKNKRARASWDGFSLSQRKDYAEWITAAKRDETRTKRLAQAVEWLAEGKPRNWKYMKKW